MTNFDKKDYVLNQLDEMKIEDIICIDTSKISSLSNYVIIGSGKSGKQIESALENLKINLKKINEGSGLISGEGKDGWILYDLGDVIVHLFTPEIRKVYKLEELFNSIKLKDEKKKVKSSLTSRTDKKTTTSVKKVPVRRKNIEEIKGIKTKSTDIKSLNLKKISKKTIKK